MPAQSLLLPAEFVSKSFAAWLRCEIRRVWDRYSVKPFRNLLILTIRKILTAFLPNAGNDWMAADALELSQNLAS